MLAFSLIISFFIAITVIYYLLAHKDHLILTWEKIDNWKVRKFEDVSFLWLFSFLLLALLLITPIIFGDQLLLRFCSFVALIIIGFYLFQTKDDKNRKSNKHEKLLLLTVLLSIFLIGAVYLFGEFMYHLYLNANAERTMYFSFYDAGKKIDAGQAGDFFGGFMNPIIGFSSLIVLTITLIVVHKSMNNAKESSDIFKAQLLTQRFEDTFFSMFNVLNDLKKDILKSETLVLPSDGGGAGSIKESESDVSKAMLLILQYNDESRKTLLGKHHNINAFFRLLYRILTHIAEFNNKKIISDFDETMYVGIIRSVITSNLYHLLLLNCMVDKNDRNFLEYKEMLIKYSFFEHLVFFPDIISKVSFSEESYNKFLEDVNTYFQDEDYKAFGDNSEIINKIKEAGSNNSTIPNRATT